MRDMTERREYEQQLEEQVEQLEQQRNELEQEVDDCNINRCIIEHVGFYANSRAGAGRTTTSGTRFATQVLAA